MLPSLNRKLGCLTSHKTNFTNLKFKQAFKCHSCIFLIKHISHPPWATGPPFDVSNKKFFLIQQKLTQYKTCWNANENVTLSSSLYLFLCRQKRPTLRPSFLWCLNYKRMWAKNWKNLYNVTGSGAKSSPLPLPRVKMPLDHKLIFNSLICFYSILWMDIGN